MARRGIYCVFFEVIIEIIISILISITVYIIKFNNNNRFWSVLKCSIFYCIVSTVINFVLDNPNDILATLANRNQLRHKSKTNNSPFYHIIYSYVTYIITYASTIIYYGFTFVFIQLSSFYYRIFFFFYVIVSKFFWCFYWFISFS